MTKKCLWLFVSILILLSACTQNTVLFTGSFDESINGDLSGDYLKPTAFQGAVGETVIKASTLKDDLDYFSFNVPTGAVLSEIILTDYKSSDPIAFAAIVEGKVFVAPFNSIDEAKKLLGWVHLGEVHLQQNFLDDMGAEATAQGYTPPLKSGDYSFWIQQTGLDKTDYALKLVVTAVSP